MTREKYVELRKKRLKERDKRLRINAEGIRAQREKDRVKRWRKWAELVARRAQTEKKHRKSRKMTKAVLESTKMTQMKVAKETDTLVSVPEMTNESNRILADANESFHVIDYERAMKLPFKAKKRGEKAGLETHKRVKVRRRAKKEEKQRRIEEQLLIEKRIEEERREAKEVISKVKKAVEEADDKTKLFLHAPDAMKKIDEMVTDAERSFTLADYTTAVKLSFEIAELMEKARLDVSKEIEEKRNRRVDMAKYFYCMTSLGEEKSFGKIGFNNSEVYSIPCKNVSAVVSDSSMKDYELTEEGARTHEVVLRQVMKETSVVPAEFGSVIRNERILKHLIKKIYKPTREGLKLVDNMVELGIKAVVNEDIVYVDPRKRKECLSDILTSLSTGAKQVVMGDLFSDRLILNASFLIDKGAADAFSEKVATLQEKYTMLNLLYTGPWAPYNFVYIKIGTEGLEIARS